MQSWQPSELLAIGDLAYNAGDSTVQDISIGQYYNNFIYPYPSPEYLSGPYRLVNGSPVRRTTRLLRLLNCSAAQAFNTSLQRLVVLVW